MKIYKLTGHVTVHDVALALGRPRQTITRWVKALGIKRVVVPQGGKLVATFIPHSAVKLLREQHHNSTIQPPTKAAD